MLNPEKKKQVEAILDKLGLSMSAAIELYWNQIIMSNGIPFNLSIPQMPKSVNCDLTPLQMKLVRFIFKTPDFTYSIDKKIKEEDKKTLLFKINVFINDMIGSTIDSVNLILKD